jgi:HK97 family phage major capsid protein
MKTLNTLIEERSGQAAKLSELVKSVDKRAFNSDEEAKFDKIEAEIKALDSTIDRMERSRKYETIQEDMVEERIAADRPASVDAEKELRSAWYDYMVEGRNGMAPKSREILQKRGTATQIVGTNSLGGYLVIPEFSKAMIEVMKAFGGVLNLITPNDSATGASLTIPKEDTTSQVGTLITETTADTVADVSWSNVSLSAYMFTSNIIKLSWEFLQDNAYNAEQRLINIAGKRIGRALSAYLTTGTGSAQPEGFITGAGAAAVTTASATVVTPDEILDLIHSLDTAYRAGATLVFNDATLKALRKFKSSTNEPIWQPSIREGVPSTIYGVPYQVIHEMASAGTTANKFMAYGNFNEAFYVRRVLADQLVVMKEKYADQRVNGYFVHSRWDAKVVNANAIKLMQHA